MQHARWYINGNAFPQTSVEATGLTTALVLARHRLTILCSYKLGAGAIAREMPSAPAVLGMALGGIGCRVYHGPSCRHERPTRGWRTQYSSGGRRGARAAYLQGRYVKCQQAAQKRMKLKINRIINRNNGENK